MPNYSVVLTGPTTGTNEVKERVLSVTLQQSLSEASSTLELELKNLVMDHCMDNITLTVDGSVVFRGKVKRQTRQPVVDGFSRFKLYCVDDTDKLHRRVVNELYQNKTAYEIITAVCSKYAHYIDLSAVQDIGNAVEELRFDYEPLSSVLNKCSEVVGGYWNVDVNNVLHFFQTTDGTVPGGFTAADVLRESFQEDTNAQDLVNRVWVIGAKVASPNYVEQNWTGDGQNYLFNLSYAPNYPEVWENGVVKTIGMQRDGGAAEDKDYMYDKGNKVLKRNAGALPSGVALRFRYRPTIQMIDFFEDAISIGQYGIYEKAIRDKKITDRVAVRQRGRAALQKTKAIMKSASFSTRTKWNVRVGQLANVELGDFSGRVESVTVRFLPYDISADIEVVEVV